MERVAGEEEVAGLGRVWVVESPRDSGEPTRSYFRRNEDAVMQVFYGKDSQPVELTFLSLPLTPELQNAMSRSAEGLIETVHPDGSVSIDLQGRFQSVSVARLDEKGRVIYCPEGAEAPSPPLEGSGETTAQGRPVR